MFDGIPTEILRFIQDSISMVPVIVIGSGASAAYGIAGMGELADYIVQEVNPLEEEKIKWEKFKQLLDEGADLESALHEIDLSDRLEMEIIKKTKKLILSKDVVVREKVALNQIEMPLTKLLRYLNSTASPQLKIITTNYDRLIEYALDDAGIDYDTGFKGSYIQKFNERMNRLSNKAEVLKVHGSLDWYSNSLFEVLSLPDSFQDVESLAPVMVTPGKRKYEHTHDDPFRSLISRVDLLFSKANSILIIGFGFNDRHIQPKLMQKMRDSETPIIIITKSLTPQARAFIKTNENSKILGIEEGSNGSNLVFPNKDDVEISFSIWELGEFIKIFT